MAHRDKKNNYSLSSCFSFKLKVSQLAISGRKNGSFSADKNARYASKKDKQNIIIRLFNRRVLLHAVALRL